jgi:hypothetical protein
MIDIVVARYKENVEWTRAAPYNVIIYNKGPYLEGSRPRPLIGREPMTFLHHIIANWYTLADYTAFVQGNPFDHAPNLPGQLYEFEANPTGFRHLGEIYLVCDRDGWPQHGGLAMGKYADMIGIHSDTFPFVVGQQFIVSRERIHARPIEFYQKMAATIELEPYEVPWVYERIWELVFTDPK